MTQGIGNLAGLEGAWPSMVESLANGVLLLDKDGNILYTNREAQRLLRRPASSLHGQPFGYPLRQGEPVEFDLLGADGSTRVIEMRAVPVGFSNGEGWVASLHDVTARAQRREQLAEQNRSLAARNAALEEASQYDPLTGLLNRQGIAVVLREQMLANVRREGRFAVLVVDIDGFARINDDYGHEAGDWTLIQAASRLRRSLRAGDHLGRVGGDEFMVLLPGCSASVASVLAEKLRTTLRETETPGDDDILNASVAVIEVAAPDGVTMERLLSACEEALERSKRLGHGHVSILPAIDHDEGTASLEDTGAGFPDDVRLYTVAQPIARVADGEVIGFEWFTRPRSSRVKSAGDFFRLTNETGDVFATNLRCLTLCLREAAHFDENTVHHFNFAAPALLESSESVLSAVLPDAPAGGVRFEISLTDMAGSATELRDAVSRLREAGAELVLEHYTPGQRFLETTLLLKPVAVKLAPGVLRRCRSAEEPVEALRRVVAPLVEAGIDVVAAGVESREDAELVEAARLPCAQGYYYGSPETPGYWRRRQPVSPRRGA